jgi:hypothetical protein
MIIMVESGLKVGLKTNEKGELQEKLISNSEIHKSAALFLTAIKLKEDPFLEIAAIAVP